MCGPATTAVWPETFGEWYTRAYPVVWRKVRATYRCQPEPAEDATQDAAEKINRRKYRVFFPEYPPFYVFYQKTALRRAGRILGSEAKGPQAVDAFLLDAMFGEVPTEEHEREARLERVRQCLKQLEPPDRGLLWLYYFAGMTQRELGKCFYLSAPTISKRLHQAKLRLLRKFLEE